MGQLDEKRLKMVIYMIEAHDQKPSLAQQKFVHTSILLFRY